MEIQQALNWARNQLAPYVSTAQLEAELLLGKILHLTRAQLLARSKEWLSAPSLQLLQQYVARRCAGEPIAYITGYREFWSLSLELSSAALIPRPETELLVEIALQKLPSQRICRVADLGTGSGAIALALAKERPHWQLTATDQSLAALQLAKSNAERLKINNIVFCQGDWCKPLKIEHFHAIVSNPPYLAAQDLHLLDKSLQFEPRSALVAADEGLADLQQIIKYAAKSLHDDGWLLLEHGYEQASMVRQFYYEFNYRKVSTYHDLAGIPRVTIGQK